MAERRTPPEAPNVNALWSRLLLDELHRTGGRHVVIAPGSRSAPLVEAAVTHPGLACHLATDERAGGFLALGIARGSGVPAAVITTSGTAVANLLPAVTEADADGVPLVLLTADRPPEFTATGANQAIHQPGIFGSRTRWAAALPCPTDAMPARVVLTTLDQAVSRARAPHAGPVHLNCAFREPLAPIPAAWDRACLAGTEAWQAGERPFTRIVTPRPTPDAREVDEIAGVVGTARRGLVIAGTLASEEDRDAVCAIASALGWPLLTDVRSGLRLRREVSGRLLFGDRLIGRAPDPHGGPDRWRPDVVLQLGSRTTSPRLSRALAAAPPATHVLIAPSDERLDPEHRLTHRVRASTRAVGPALADRIARSGPPSREVASATAKLVELDRRLGAAMSTALSEDPDALEVRVAHALTRHAAGGRALVVSNSLPVRDVDAYGATDGDHALVATSRGASGIDGILATGVGVAIGADAPATVLIGDQAMHHDLGSLTLAAACPVPITVVVVNNGGGAIFHGLPIAAHRSIFSPWFDAAHSRRFEGAARDVGLDYARVTDTDAFADAYGRACASGRSTMIEVVADGAAGVGARERLESALARARDSRA